ncbi:MAG TPA: ATP-dependent protease ATPase subunit HslU [Candidatus Hydrogenedens sp.]|nr:ATP-dependent protease ATPase subunit HslU [Candidatus Hydrogenedens sp.]HOL20769.1 ATP-dependent protease ATPase subunit HslU [Candidatus Hydrogenedens sp.]HPP57858.1 ATP-dependent protease ATPase subunit HslU [Candidatus Hydrogenedens sp.]
MLNEKELIPRKIVEELDKYIVGQDEAKKKVAIALRNRWRRQMIRSDLKDDVIPKNIIMIGPTGVGKTEIARRLAKLVNAPFIKVEASRFTEVGYVGRDCESMIRELVDVAVNMVKEEMKEQKRDEAKKIVEDKLVELLLPKQPRSTAEYKPFDPTQGDEKPVIQNKEESFAKAREILKERLKQGLLEDKEIEIDVKDSKGMPLLQVFSGSSLDEMEISLQEMLGKFMPQSQKRRRVKISEARKILESEILQDLIDMEQVTREAIDRVQNTGIIFLDEIDKIASRGSPAHGPDVSREGVQRDILPIVEGSTVLTKYGPVRTDHILFIAAGAFHMTKVSDLIPELQGRFPIRVELKSLNKEDFRRILTEPKNSLIRQYIELLETEQINVSFAQDAIECMAEYCEKINQQTEDIGARRLHTIMEVILEDLMYDVQKYKDKEVVITREQVEAKLSTIIENRDLTKYIL